MFDVMQKNLSIYGTECFSASTSKTVSVSIVENMSYMECTATSHLASYPPHSCRFPTVFVTSSSTMLMTVFPVFLRTTSPILIGRKPGFLSKNTSPPAISASSDGVFFWNSI